MFIGTLGSGIWCANLDQVNRLKPLNNSFLSSFNVYQLLVDDNTIWIGSEKGLDLLKFNNNEITNSKHFNANDGFIGIETSLNTAIKTQDNLFWFGTKNGITKYTPANNVSRTTKPAVFFENIAIENQDIESLNNPIISKTLQLNPLQNSCSFTYKTVDLNYPDRIQYQWKLNDETSNWSTLNSINFANLTPGEYTFSVVSKNADKQVSKPLQFRFFIDKPIYKKTWFIIACVAIFLLLVLIVTTNYIQQIKKKNKEKINKLTLENHLITLEQKALQLQMNPHFIFNVLNGIKALGNKNNTQDLNKTISQFSSLLRGILHNSRQEEINLLEEIETLKNYIELEQRMASISFNYSIENEVESIDLEEILVPPMLLQPFIENSIKHGFTGKTKAPKIIIRFAIKKHFLHCSILDNGIGFNQTQKINGNHKSVAIEITRERIKSLSKYSTLEISEITKENNVIGTKVSIKIPLKTDY